jgi:PAS domain S-box-containing protein
MEVSPAFSDISDGSSDYALYYSLVQHLPKMAIMVFDRDFRYLLADGELLRQFGFTKEQLVGKTIWDVLPKSSADSLVGYYEAPFRDEKVSFEQEYGDVICLTQAVPLKDAYGHIYAGMFISRDVSENRRRQIELRRAEEQYHTLFDNVLDGVIILEAPGRIVFANNIACQMLGHTETEICTLDVTDLFAEPESEFLNALEIVNKTGILTSEAHVRRQNGSIFMADVSCKIYPSGDKASLIIRDITARKVAERKIEEQRNLAAAHYEFSLAIINNFEPDDMFEQLLVILLRVFSCDVADIRCVETNKQARIMHLHGYDIDPAGPYQLNEAFRQEEDCLTHHIVTTGQPFLAGDIREIPSWKTILADNSLSFLAVPVRLDNDMIGIIRVSAKEPNHFDEDRIQQLMHFAVQMSLAIKNIRLHRRLQNNAVSYERQRLARELHDSVTQTLFSASMVAQSLPHLWKYGEIEVKQAIADLGRLAQGALAEMRTLLVELRPEAIEAGDLPELLKYLLDALAGQRQLSIDLQCSGHTKLPADVQVVFYRIAQEALNNILKHSEATTVHTRLMLKVDQAELHIADNGRGFDKNIIPANHFGLSTITERAREIGAVLTVDSAMGKGTQLTLIWNASATTHQPEKALRS